MKYRKKPIVIEAEQYKEGMEDGFTESMDDEFTENHIIKMIPYIQNPDGGLMYLIYDGFWIITGTNGQRITCNPDIFEETYEIVKE